MIPAIIQSMRPRQWSKNFFVLAAIMFTLDAHHPVTDFARVALAFAIFCLLSSGIYLINDILDVENDRKHPVKCKRPIPAGRLSTTTAGWTAAILLSAALLASTALNEQFTAVAAIYTVLMIAYSSVIKNLVILDVLTIAGGFVLRAVAGAVVIHIMISAWLLMCTVLIALFLGLAKRRVELVGLKDDAVSHRSSLADYTVPFLDQLINITAASTIMAYAMYSFFSQTGARHHYIMATLPFVIYGIFRYLLLIHKGTGAGSPELLLLEDRPLLINMICWTLSCAVIIMLR